MSADVCVCLFFFLEIWLSVSVPHPSSARSALKKSLNISSVTERSLHPEGLVLYCILLMGFYIHFLCVSNLCPNHMSLIHYNGQRVHVQNRTRDDCFKKWMSGNLYNLYNFQRRMGTWNDILVRRKTTKSNADTRSGLVMRQSKPRHLLFVSLWLLKKRSLRLEVWTETKCETALPVKWTSLS